LTSLRHWVIYRNPAELPVDHEGVWLTGSEGEVTAQDKMNLLAEEAAGSLLDHGTSQRFMQPLAHFFEQLEQGNLPDVALLTVARDCLVSEVTSRVDEVQILSQLRIRDAYTYDHTLDVTAVSIALAKHIGLDDETIRDVGLAAILHDLGKILIPKAIMFKTSRLTVQEFEVMKLHPRLGYNMIRDVLKLPEHIACPALEHQELHGGGGYPLNLKGDEIHPFSQIVKIADVYDALTSKRPYKQPIPSNKAIKIMLSEGEKSFNPVLLAKFVEMANYQEAS
jgi:HD-GYP domain-containing protein (c-di-GMP phosphodiesterase class II)